MATSKSATYDYLIKLLLIGDSGMFILNILIYYLSIYFLWNLIIFN